MYGTYAQSSFPWCWHFLLNFQNRVIIILINPKIINIIILSIIDIIFTVVQEDYWDYKVIYLDQKTKVYNLPWIKLKILRPMEIISLHYFHTQIWFNWEDMLLLNIPAVQLWTLKWEEKMLKTLKSLQKKDFQTLMKDTITLLPKWKEWDSQLKILLPLWAHTLLVLLIKIELDSRADGHKTLMSLTILTTKKFSLETSQNSWKLQVKLCLLIIKKWKDL